MIPCPMSLGCAGLIDPIVQFKDNAFLGTSAHESVLPVGYLPATRRIPAFPRCGSHPRQTLAGSSEIALGRAGADLGPTWGHLGANLNQNLSTWGRNVRFGVEMSLFGVLDLDIFINLVPRAC